MTMLGTANESSEVTEKVLVRGGGGTGTGCGIGSGGGVGVGVGFGVGVGVGVGVVGVGVVTGGVVVGGVTGVGPPADGGAGGGFCTTSGLLQEAATKTSPKIKMINLFFILFDIYFDLIIFRYR
jgi:hypothetical protein